jgi:WD40 repeat protein
MLPADVIVNHLLPFLDRTTFDACILLNREVYRLSRPVLPPWPLEATLQLSRELTCIDASPYAIACGCQTGQVILIWRRTGKRVEFQTAGGRMAAVTVVAFSDDDAQQQQQHLAIGRVDGSIQILHFVQGEVNEQTVTMLYHHQSPPTDSNQSVSCITLNGRHTAPIHSLVFYGTDQKYLVSAAMDDESVHFWNTTNGDRIKSIMDYQMGFSAIALSPNEQTLAAIDWDGSLSLYPLAKDYGMSNIHRMMSPYRSIHPGLAMTTQLQFSNDGKFLFGIRNGDLQRWDFATGDYSLVPCPNRATTKLNPQGDCLARYIKGMIGIEPVQEGQGFSQSNKKVTEQKWYLAFSHDGRMLIVGGVNGQVQFWSNYEQQFLGNLCPTSRLVLPEMSRNDSTDLTNRLAFGVCNNCVAGSVCLFSKQGLGC